MARQLKALDFDPLKELIDMYHGGQVPPQTKVDIAKTIMEYVYPKLRAVDVTQKVEGGVTIKIMKFSEDGPVEKTIGMDAQSFPTLQPIPRSLVDVGDDDLPE